MLARWVCIWWISAVTASSRAVAFSNIIAFLVLGLVKGNVGIFVDALLNHVGDNLRLLLELCLLPLQFGGVKK